MRISDLGDNLVTFYCFCFGDSAFPCWMLYYSYSYSLIVFLENTGLNDLMAVMGHYEKDSGIRGSILQVVRNYLDTADLTRSTQAIDQLEILR